MLTLAGHGFYWFELSKPRRAAPPTSTRTGRAPPRSSVADSLLAAGVVSAAEETPGDNAPRDADQTGGSR